MPNTVRNRIIVTGPEEGLKALISAISYDEKEHVLDYRSKDGTVEFIGYDAKWIGYQDGKVDAYLMSNWGPPYYAIELMSNDFPKLAFDLTYQGDGPFYGRELIKGGEAIMTSKPDSEEEFAEVVNRTSYKYEWESQEKFEQRQQDEMENLIVWSSEEDSPPSPLASDPPVISLWLAGIGALGAYTYFKNR